MDVNAVELNHPLTRYPSMNIFKQICDVKKDSDWEVTEFSVFVQVNMSHMPYCWIKLDAFKRSSHLVQR